MNRGTRRVHSLLLLISLFFLIVLVGTLTGCSPCPEVYAVGCAPFPTSAPRQ